MDKRTTSAAALVLATATAIAGGGPAIAQQGTRGYAAAITSSGSPAISPAPAATPAQASAPAPANCEAPEHRQFDFWVGEWTVTMGGQHAGDSRIEKLLIGCAIFENWRGARGREGKSLNFYDRSRGVWHQTWMSDTGNALALDGRFADGKMTLIGQRTDPATTVTTTSRITWTPLPTGQVRQVWESSTDGGNTWSMQFDGLYTRKQK